MPSSGWYSKKFNKAGLAYELGIAIYHNQLVWINGPFPAGQNDKKIFNKPVGNPDKITTRNSFDSDPVKKFKRRVKARHETFNGRLQAFGILNHPFRSTGPTRLEKHKAAFEACCVIVQYEMDNGHPLFKV
jgi:hypothetical protein